ncbi:protein root UVB sensitive 4 isoform X3 [Durio zibethinus]|uniref:Protein root UVB sensitive 4 isoform X3 n=1 Tax=Durio zibethinus TaxID=66656 RepID=A0A6P5ZFN8_DURZI|nr:protein root UVB sensitive 4 isoform X3 [Durio zibethinus]
MQSTLYYAPSNSRHFALPWKSPKTPTSRNSHLSSKTLTLNNSLRTQITYELEGDVNDGLESSNPAQLPIAIRRYGKVSRFFWDGNRVKLLSIDGFGGAGASFCFNLDKVVEVSSLAFRNFFIPKQVSENYMGYVKWKFLHRVFSSALQVLATQAMFRAMGIGHSHSLPSAAAFNWVLKDGLGRLSRCIYTASLASAFDTNLKSAIHRSFAIADNLAEVSAKSQIQSVCFDNLGLMLAAALNMLLKNNQRLQAGLPFIVYPFFSAVDLCGIYQGLKHVHLQTLTKDRLEIILDAWIAIRHVPSPEEVSKEEDFNFIWSKGKEPWRIRIGCLNPKGQLPKLSMMTMQYVGDKDYYFVCMEIFYRRLARTREQGILLCLREGACTADIIKGLLQACYVRKALRSSSWESMMKASDFSDLILKEWFKLIKDSKQRAQLEFGPLKEQMVAVGWAIKNILLNTEEQARYSYIDD